jgi:hypothetical protein
MIASPTETQVVFTQFPHDRHVHCRVSLNCSGQRQLHITTCPWMGFPFISQLQTLPIGPSRLGAAQS